MKLSPEGLEQARAYIAGQARPLERALDAHFFGVGTVDAVLAELAAFQNPDGGFGHGLEPDLQTPASSALATSIAFQILRELQVPETHPMVRAGIRYLLNTYDAEEKRWSIIPAGAEEAPHAPWWNYDDDLANRFGQYLANPRAEILGYLHDYAGLVPPEMIDLLHRSVLDHLDTLPDEMEMHDLLCYRRLMETPRLPEPDRAKIQEKLRRAVDRVVVRDESQLAEYGLEPLAVAPSPVSPFAPLLRKEIDMNLDNLIEHQQEDGSWAPTWSWGSDFPEAWPAAEQAWKGVLTVSALRRLEAFDRLP